MKQPFAIQESEGNSAVNSSNREDHNKSASFRKPGINTDTGTGPCPQACSDCGQHPHQFASFNQQTQASCRQWLNPEVNCDAVLSQKLSIQNDGIASGKDHRVVLNCFPIWEVTHLMGPGGYSPRHVGRDAWENPVWTCFSQ